MNILLTGARGQLGQHMAPLLADRGSLVETSRSGGCGNHEDAGRGDVRQIPCDLADGDAVTALLEQTDPDVIVSTAAWTDVDGAESNPEAALRMNRDLPGLLGRWCAARDRRLMHFSTDYVFNGTGNIPLREDMPTEPINCYGQSKLAGEQAIAHSGAQAIVLRTSWVYSALPGNFLTAVVGRAQQGKALKVVDDQIGNPTWAGALAEAAAWCLDRWLEKPLPGPVYHVSCKGAMSWFEFACIALNRAHGLGLLEQRPRIEAISSAQWPQEARRPAWSVLDCNLFEKELEYKMPDVGDALDRCLATRKPFP